MMVCPANCEMIHPDDFIIIPKVVPGGDYRVGRKMALIVKAKLTASLS